MELYLHASSYRLFEKAVAEVMGGGTGIFANERLHRSPSYRFFQNAIATVTGAARALRETMSDRDFPGFMSPHDRIFFIRQRLEEYYNARGRPDIKVRLNDTPRSALTSISRTRIYAEYIGDDEYLALISHQFP